MHGEYKDAKYIKHPPGGTALSPGVNGTTFDAGTAILVDSNVSRLTRQASRLLVSSIGPPGAASAFQTSADMYAGTTLPLPNDQYYGGNYPLPWDRRVAMRFGPFPMIQDQYDGTVGTNVARSVRFAVSLSGTITGSVTVSCAVTTSPSAAALAAGQYVMRGSASGSATFVTATLTATQRIPSAETWPCRRNSATASNDVYVLPMWCWVGWACIGTSSTIYVNGISIWEHVP